MEPDPFEGLFLDPLLLHGFSPDSHTSLELNRVTSKYHEENVFHGISSHVALIPLDVMLIDQSPINEKLEPIIVKVLGKSQVLPFNIHRFESIEVPLIQSLALNVLTLVHHDSS